MVIVGGGRRGVGRMASAACVGGLLLGAAGCTAAPKPAPPSPTPTITPIFASDEEALAAATEAYANYQNMSDQIDSEGGIDPERIAPFVSASLLPTAVHQSDGFREAGARSVGSTTFLVAGTQELSYASLDEIAISLYICDDVSEVDVLDENGSSLVSEIRDSVTPFEVGFVLNSDEALIVDSRDVWQGKSFC
ncbi:hypothetical protein [Cryobacterium sp. TMT4-31]|uniref:hypothetical protein n=1 Tax=Cryobacterium sp. TMT4-31 TaxID=1259259 RepID=UPI00106CEE04|nr:hypothetical protein [Cryobacterium sp. TMT4-31]TFC84836.1 hypothetical protein E3T19_17840 [Cryobacterium sp. TMT4-31]